MERDLLAGDELEVRPAADQAVEGELRLELAEARADAVVDPLAEGEAAVR